MDKREEAVRREMRSSLDNEGQLGCTEAHQIAEKLGIEPGYVGEQADEIEIRITRCQLGLFGYAPKKGMPGYKLVKKLDKLPEAATASIKKTAAQDRISCLELWEFGKQHGLTRVEMGSIAETLDIKVAPCQLGCF